MGSVRFFDGKTYRDMTADELAKMEAEARLAQIEEATRPLSVDEVLRLILRAQVNSLDIPDATASRMIEYFPALTGDGSLVKAGARINWNGVLKQAAVDLWDTAENNPDNAPALWSDIAYREGIRIIPETITASQAFTLDEPGWWDGHIYRSTMADNVYTPEQYAAGWERVR